MTYLSGGRGLITHKYNSLTCNENYVSRKTVYAYFWLIFSFSSGHKFDMLFLGHICPFNCVSRYSLWFFYGKGLNSV